MFQNIIAIDGMKSQFKCQSKIMKSNSKKKTMSISGNVTKQLQVQNGTEKTTTNINNNDSTGCEVDGNAMIRNQEN